jgi:hypothetical protein
MTRPSLADVEDLLAGQAAAMLPGADLLGRLRDADQDGQALAALRAAWDDLPRDKHLADRAPGASAATGGCWPPPREGGTGSRPCPTRRSSRRPS